MSKLDLPEVEDMEERELEFPVEEESPVEAAPLAAKLSVPGWAAMIIKLLPIIITLVATALSVMGYDHLSEGLAQIAKIIKDFANP